MNSDQFQSVRFSAWHNGADVHPQDLEAIDDVLRLVATYHASLGAELGDHTTTRSLIAMRQAPLGRKLQRLAAAARDRYDGDTVALRTEAYDVISLLLQSLAVSDHDVPAWFWQTAIGQILAAAIYRTYSADQLLCLASAAERLDTDQESVEALLAKGTITAVRDETGKPFIPVAQIERLRTVARAFDGTAGPPVDALVATRAA